MNTSGPRPVFVRFTPRTNVLAPPTGVAYHVNGEPLSDERPSALNDIWDHLGALYPDGYSPLTFTDGDGSDEEAAFLAARTP